LAKLAVFFLGWSLAASAEQDVFEQDFRSTMSPTKLRLVGGEQPTKYCTVSANGLKCTIPPGTEAVSTCGVETRFVIRGDFEITAGFQLLDVPKPDQGQGAGVKISIKDSHGEWASLQRIHLSKRGQVFSAHRAVKQPDDKYKHSSEIQPTESKTGKLKLVRKKDQLTYLVAEDDSSEFTEVRTEAFTSDEIPQIFLAVQTGGAKTGVDSVWTDLRILADQIHYPHAPVASKLPSRWPYLAIPVAVFALIGVVVVFVRRGRAS
jgi:hypothetical protein